MPVLEIHWLTVMFWIAGFLSFALAASYAGARKLRRNAWGREYGLTRRGRSYGGVVGASRVDVVLREETFPISPNAAPHERRHGLTVVAAVTVAAKLPVGLVIRAAAAPGDCPGAPVLSSDSDFEHRFQVCGEDVAACEALLANEALRNALLTIRAGVRDLEVRDGRAFAFVALVQREIDDPREALTKGYRAAMRTAQVLTAAAEGRAIHGVEARRRPLGQSTPTAEEVVDGE
ncbi:MAG: hypothetical protein ICCCNLDF_02078 [Planctomycetes bacterium]|nr:hypothetical protein [Planctomycetota bacterium]